MCLLVFSFIFSHGMALYCKVSEPCVAIHVLVFMFLLFCYLYLFVFSRNLFLQARFQNCIRDDKRFEAKQVPLATAVGLLEPTTVRVAQSLVCGRGEKRSQSSARDP